MAPGDRLKFVDIYYPPGDETTEPIGRIDVIESMGGVVVKSFFLGRHLRSKTVGSRLPFFERRTDKAIKGAVERVDYAAEMQLDFGSQDPLLT